MVDALLFSQSARDRTIGNAHGGKQMIQKVTLKLVEHAGQSICRSPGLRFILNWRSHPGHETSTRGMCGVSVKCVEHEAQRK